MFPHREPEEAVSPVNSRFIALAALLVAILAGAVVLAVVTMPNVSGHGAAAFDRRVRAYLMTHPEVIMEAVAVLERRNHAQRATDVKGAIARHRGRLENPAPLPALGNPSGDVTVVEFFDYRCPYCRQAAGEVEALLEADKGVRLVLKEFPVLGPESVLAARAAIAAHRQGKYLALHRALMAHDGALDKAAVMALATAAGLDTGRLAADMARPETDAVIRDSHGLARALGINGTPAFVVGDRLMPGLVPAEALARAVAEARGTGAARR